MEQKPFKLSPSDLTFLWSECKRCFYLKLVHGFPRPSAPFPSIFTRIDGLMKAFFMGKPTTELHEALPPGWIEFGDRWVQSLPFASPNSQRQGYIRGIFDSVVRFDDGSFGVVDFKTSTPKPTHRQFYSRQLHAYAYALEHAAPGKFALQPISRMGLLIVEPNAIERLPSGDIAYTGRVTWQEITYDEAKFTAFLAEVIALLEQPEPPQPGENCGYCKYRAAARENQW